MAPSLLTYNDIQRRAYELWEKRGRPAGYESEFWVEAERQLRLEAGVSIETDGLEDWLESNDPRSE